MTKLGKKQLTPDQRNAIVNALKTHLEAAGNGNFRFKPNTSDALIAASYGVSEKQVAILRTQWIGKLEPVTPFVKYPDLVKRVEQLEEQIGRLVAMSALRAPQSLPQSLPRMANGEQRIPINGA